MACVLFFSCEKREDLYGTDEFNLPKGSSIPADGVSTLPIMVKFNDELHPEQKVSFYTSEGTLYKMPYDPVEAGSDSVVLKPFGKTAEVLLQSNNSISDTVYVSVNVNGVIRQEIVSFTPALPEDMQFSASDHFLAVNEEATITADLFRAKGTSSDKLKCWITDKLLASDTTQPTLFLDYPDFAFSEGNQVSFTVGALQHSPGSQVEIELATLMASGDTLKKSIMLWLE